MFDKRRADFLLFFFTQLLSPFAKAQGSVCSLGTVAPEISPSTVTVQHQETAAAAITQRETVKLQMAKQALLASSALKSLSTYINLVHPPEEGRERKMG